MWYKIITPKHLCLFLLLALSLLCAATSRAVAADAVKPSALMQKSAQPQPTELSVVIDGLNPSPLTEDQRDKALAIIKKTGEASIIAQLLQAAKIGGVKTVREPIASLGETQHDMTVRGAIYALGEIGPAAAKASLPYLTGLLYDRKGEPPACCGKMDIFGEPTTRSANSLIRLNAVIALGKFGALAKDAVPALIFCLSGDPDGGVSNAASHALRRIGFPAILPLRQMAEVKVGWFEEFFFPSVKKDRKEHYERMLWEVLPGYSIWKRLQDDDAQNKKWEASRQKRGLKYISREEIKLEDQLQIINQYMNDRGNDDPANRALEQLGRYIALHQNEADLRPLILALHDLWKKADALPSYRKSEMLTGGWPNFMGLIDVTGALGDFGETFVPILIEQLKHSPSSEVQDKLVLALISIGAKAVPALREVLQQDDLRASLLAVRALETIYTKESWQALQEFWHRHRELPYPYPAEAELFAAIGQPR